jgi:hypothetical protein
VRVFCRVTEAAAAEMVTFSTKNPQAASGLDRGGRVSASLSCHLTGEDHDLGLDYRPPTVPRYGVETTTRFPSIRIDRPARVQL